MPVSLRLLPLLNAYLDGEIPLYELRGHFYGGHIEMPDEVADALYRAVSMHLAMYTAGDWPEEELKVAIRWHIARRTGEDVQPPIPVMGKQWADIMARGMAPWPVKVGKAEIQS